MAYDNLKIGDKIRVLYDDAIAPNDGTYIDITKEVFARNEILKAKGVAYDAVYSGVDAHGILLNIVDPNSSTGGTPAQQFESLPLARTQDRSYVVEQTFTGLNALNPLAIISIKVDPGEKVYVHKAEVALRDLLEDSKYNVAFFSTESIDVTGGTAPFASENELTRIVTDRTKVNPTATFDFPLPLSQDVYTRISFTQGNTTTFDVGKDIQEFRKLESQPVLLDNRDVFTRWILLVVQVNDLITGASAPSEDISVSVDALYSVL